MADKLSERLERISRAPGIANNPAYTKAIREAAELARRVEGAPVGRLDIGRDDFDDAEMVEIVMDPNHVSHLQYQRVCLVPEQGECEP